MKKNIIKKSVFILTAILSIFLLTACGLSPKSMLSSIKYKMTGRANAVKYIKEKYGFKPKVTEVKNQYNEPGVVPILFPDPNGMVTVKMEYEGTDFSVSITGKSKSTDGSDSYEKDTILASLESDIKEIYPDLVKANFPNIESEYCLFDAKFDGENYQDLFDKIQIVLKFSGRDLRTVDYSLLFDKFDCRNICMIDYKNTDCMPLDTNGSFTSYGYNTNSLMPYVNQYLFISPDMEEPYIEDITSYEYDGIVYCTTEDEPIKVSVLSETEKQELLNQLYKADTIKSFSIELADAYHVQSNAKSVVACVPLSYKKSGTYLEISSPGPSGCDESFRIKDSEYLCCELYSSKEDYQTDIQYGIFLLEKDEDYFIDKHLEEIEYGMF